MQRGKMLALLIASGALVVSFQNCSGVKFSAAKDQASVNKLDEKNPDLVDDDSNTPDDPSEPSDPTGPIDPNDPESPQNPAKICQGLSEEFVGFTPGRYTSLTTNGSGNHGIYFAHSVVEATNSGSGNLAIAGSTGNDGIGSVRQNGSGEIIICYMNVDELLLNGSGSIHIVGGNVLNSARLNGSGKLRIYSMKGNLISVQ